MIDILKDFFRYFTDPHSLVYYIHHFGIYS